MPSERIQRRIDALLDEADSAFAARDWVRLRDLAGDVLKLEPENADARVFAEAASQGLGEKASSSPEHTEAAPAAPSEPLPASFVAGRYAVRRFLGEGGSKKVYLGEDTRLEREVALAVVEGLDLLSMERVRREARAVARLGDHPHIVAIYDTAEDHGQLLTVYQYMAGGDVARLLAEEKQLPTARTLAIAKDVCRALAAIHQAGIVHRDLKPANVFLAADGSARVGDFGLATAHGIDRITQHGTILGTVSYMPPEQALGGDVTAQSDLYSLGCLLYELVTGRPPFVGDDPTAVITQHLNVPPVAPSFLADGCPASFEKVILQLLEKDPGKRPGSATAVLASLEAVNPEEASARHSTENPLARLSKGVFVGREKELEKLRTAFDEAFAGHGGLVLLVGEPGIGKTRTTQELETYARVRGATVLWGRTHESSGAPPYWPWVQAGNQWAAQEGTNLQLSPDTIGELSRIFPVLRQTPNFVEPRVESDPEAAQFRLFDAYATFLRAMAEQAPLVVALDDLHWADKPTLLLLQHVARELSRSRILVVGNYRDTDITRQSALSESLASLHRESGFERIVLRGLSREEVAAYIRAKANVEPKREVLDRIFEETEGNAFFLSELVNLMAEEGTLSKDSISDIAIPDGVKEALGRRLNRLSPETNELLQVATIIGREFAYDTLVALGDRDEDELLKLIEEALEARVIEELPQPGRYRFTHAQMQETLLAELSTTRRVRLHGQVGEALEKRWGARAEEYASRLAEHFVEAAMLSPRHATKALRYSQHAGIEAADKLAWQDAANHYSRALEQVEAAGGLAPLDEAALHEGLGRAYAAMGGGHERDGLRELTRAFRAYADARDAEQSFRVAEFVGVSGLMGARAEGLLGEAIGLEPEGSVPRGTLEAYLGQRQGTRGVYEEALRRLGTALKIAEKTGDRRLALTASRHRATVQDFNGRLGLEDHVQAAALADELGDFVASAGAHTMAALGHLTHDLDLNRAAAHIAKARLSAEKTGLSSVIVTTTYFEANVHLSRGELALQEPLQRALGLSPLDPRILSTKFFFALAVGDDETALETLGVFGQLARDLHGVERGGLLTWGICVGALWWWMTGSEDALRLAERLGAEYGGAPARGAGSDRLIHPSRGLLAIASGNRDRAAAWHDEASPGESWRRSGVPVFELVLGLVDEALGRIDEALSHYDEAFETYRPSLFHWSMVGLERARLLLDLGRPEAAEAIDQVLAVTTQIGMNRWRDKAVALRVKLQGITSDDMRSSIVAVNAAVQSEHPDLRPQAAPDGTVTLLFSDIENSTPLNERLGDARYMELLRAHNALIETQVKAHRGYVVKTMGDGYMVAFKSAADGLRCAIAIQEAIAGMEEVVRVRIGLHTGEMVKDDNDFFGRHVTLAARVASLAAGGEILVSGIVHELVAGQGFAFDGGREADLKGLAGTHRVYRVVVG